MFTGIIETIGEVKSICKEGSNYRYQINSKLLAELKVDQSVAHNGVCLTIEKLNKDCYEVVAVEETIKKTALRTWNEGMIINLERCMQLNGRLDGHIVQGHVDETAVIKELIKRDGSWVFSFQLKNATKLIVERGSITINGVSLTVFDITNTTFKVTIIPYTFENTSFRNLKEGDQVNIEYDIIGKYVERLNS